MSLRYKGMPHKGSNRQVDKLDPLCLCTFVAIGEPLDASRCTVHLQFVYSCDRCLCFDYRPAYIKMSPAHWPRCVCGHIAQGHNNSVERERS